MFRTIKRNIRALFRSLRWACIGWRLCEYDYNDCLVVLKESLYPLKDHLFNKNCLGHDPKTFKNIGVAVALLERNPDNFLSEFYVRAHRLDEETNYLQRVKEAQGSQETDWNYLFDILKSDMRSWWC